MQSSFSGIVVLFQDEGLQWEEQGRKARLVLSDPSLSRWMQLFRVMEKCEKIQEEEGWGRIHWWLIQNWSLVICRACFLCFFVFALGLGDGIFWDAIWESVCLACIRPWDWSSHWEQTNKTQPIGDRLYRIRVLILWPRTHWGLNVLNREWINIFAFLFCCS